METICVGIASQQYNVKQRLTGDGGDDGGDCDDDGYEDDNGDDEDSVI